MAQSLRRRAFRRDRSGDREQSRLGGERDRGRRQGRARCRQAAFAGLGRQKAARARRDFAQGLRADHARRRAARQADHDRERQGAVATRAARSPMRRNSSAGIAEEAVRNIGQNSRRAVDRRPHLRAAQAGRHRGAGDAVEFPRRDGDPQDRPGARRRLPGGAQAGVGDAAHHAGADADPRRGRRAGRRRQRHSVALAPARS